MASSPPPQQNRSSSNGGSSNPPTQLEFTQAMTDFKVMFPDLEADVIETVLRANNGAVDITIDHLLTMTADNEAAKCEQCDDKPPAYAGQPPPSYHQATKDESSTRANMGGEAAFCNDLINLGGQDEGQTSKPESQPTTTDILSEFDSLGASGGATRAVDASNEKGPAAAAASPSEVKYGGSPKHAYSHPKRQEADEQHFQSQQQQPILPTQQQLHEIYEENLRLREVKGADAQYLEDERIALMLQNEEFMAELRRDTEFMTALEMEQERATLTESSSSKNVNPSGKTSKGSATMLDDEFRDKLKNMGKTSKKKFSQLAAIFSRRKSAAKQYLAAPSKDNLLLNAEPLVNEEDSDTEQDTTTSNTNNSGKSKQKTPTKGQKGKYTSFS